MESGDYTLNYLRGNENIGGVKGLFSLNFLMGDEIGALYKTATLLVLRPTLHNSRISFDDVTP